MNLYINTGTFLPNISKTDDDKNFAQSNQMSWVFAYNTNEDMYNNSPNKFPTLDAWNGIKKKDYY